jgi:uncharacterized 2Fe-2S/4Fe-4S cluster protein (DUF4445 family)
VKLYTIRFLPADIQLQARAGANLLQLAVDAGVHINAPCGGEGACGKCRVIITSGQVDCRDGSKISSEDHARGYRQACQSFVLSDVDVLIPDASALDASVLQGERHATRHAVTQEIESLVKGAWYNPAHQKYKVQIDPPSIEDNTSDLSRLLRALKKQHGLENISVDFFLLRRLSKIIRETNWLVTVTIAQIRMESQLGEHQIRGSRSPKLVAVEPGDATDSHYAIALDIGTTTLWGRLIDLNAKRSLAVASEYNPQIQFGDDVITRIVNSQKAGGLKQLQDVVVAGLNRIISELLDKTGVERQQVSLVTAAGNTTMTHLLMGLDPKYIREAPYTPVANFIPPVRALRIGLEVADSVELYTFPSVSSYVGGDIVSGVLSSGMYQRSELTLYIDIGTNGEIVVGNADWLMTASCSAGPAFEGGGLRFGMRATTGAIERYRVSPESFEPLSIITIGKAKPRGICGSGAINILAEFMKKGIIAQNGKYNSLPTSRIRPGADGMEYILAYKEETDGQEDIVLTESCIDNLIRAKAAMFAGYQCLLDKVGLTYSQLDRVIIAGAFGDFIDLDEAIAIGLLPEIPAEKYVFIGNGSLLGAQLVSLSSELLDDCERIAKKMTNIELSEDSAFMDKYMAGIFLPHTDGRLFPTIMAQISELKKNTH